MKPADIVRHYPLTFSEAKALADAAARRLKQQAQERADPNALRVWRMPPLLARWMAERVR
jgi:hypothetical protein